MKEDWNLTPSQRLWIELYGPLGVPQFDEKKVLEIINRLPERERTAVKLRFGFEGEPLSFEKLCSYLPRADGKMGVSKELARLITMRALRMLRFKSDLREAIKIKKVSDETGRSGDTSRDS
jgi:hypothetical protein